MGEPLLAVGGELTVYFRRAEGRSPAATRPPQTFPVIATTVDHRAKPGDDDYEWGRRT